MDANRIVTRKDLAIRGGKFPASGVTTFLKLWATAWPQMPWRIWEWVSDIQFTADNALPNDPQWLERGRVFGAGGDLELRRDGEWFRWRFVGLPKALPSENLQNGGFLMSDYWSQYTDPLTPVEHSALLWGQELRDGETPLKIWQDDRVGGAMNLVYPGMSGKSSLGRAQLNYREYLCGGNVEAVWWYDLTGWEPDKKAGGAQ
ncbi:MAG: hypothetical protein JXA21_00185 [Anaerolineae bacterium]|nr:hypothetical protein [Anaerolineae bacterium]